MVDLADDFVPAIANFELAALEAPGSSICGIRPDFTIAYRNPAWHRFALENGGAPALERWGLGTNILDAIDAPLAGYFHANFRQCLEDGDTWHHEYECSGPEYPDYKYS